MVSSASDRNAQAPSNEPWPIIGAISAPTAMAMKQPAISTRRGLLASDQ